MAYCGRVPNEVERDRPNLSRMRPVCAGMGSHPHPPPYPPGVSLFLSISLQINSAIHDFSLLLFAKTMRICIFYQ